MCYWGKIEVFVHLFQKVVVSRGEAFGRLPQKVKHFIVRRIFESVKTFCKRKSFHKLPDCIDCPRKVPSGKFSAVPAKRITVYICTNMCRCALTCGSIETALQPLSLFVLL